MSTLTDNDIDVSLNICSTLRLTMAAHLNGMTARRNDDHPTIQEMLWRHLYGTIRGPEDLAHANKSV